MARVVIYHAKYGYGYASPYRDDGFYVKFDGSKSVMSSYFFNALIQQRTYIFVPKCDMLWEP